MRAPRRITAREVRLSLGFYTNPDVRADRQPLLLTVFSFLLRSVCLTLEVFLRTRIGKRYLTVPKAFVGSFFPYLCLVLAEFDFFFFPRLHPIRPGAIEVVEPFVEQARNYDWKSALERVGELNAAIFDEQTALDVLGPVTIAIGIYGFVVNVQLVWNFIAEHIWKRRRHPYSSGDPHGLWDPVYMLGNSLNLRVDIVKQIGEPGACIAIGWIIRKFLPHEYHFLSMWLIVGGLALLAQAYLENKRRDQLAMDGLANELNSQAFHLQQQMTGDQARDAQAVRVKGRV